MLSRVYEIRRATFHLEESVKNIDYKSFKTQYDQIERQLNELKDLFYTENASIIKKYSDFDVSKMRYEEINELEFLFKPTHTKNVYEGNYIENFSEERTEQLQRAGAFDAHNEFWMQYPTIHGNIFGSVPADLITAVSSETLIRQGWIRINVKIFDFGMVKEKQHLMDYCDKFFSHYIIVTEGNSKRLLVLKYEVEKKY